jgi:hypothetical protein
MVTALATVERPHTLDGYTLDDFPIGHWDYPARAAATPRDLAFVLWSRINELDWLPSYTHEGRFGDIVEGLQEMANVLARLTLLGCQHLDTLSDDDKRIISDAISRYRELWFITNCGEPDICPDRFPLQLWHHSWSLEWICMDEEKRRALYGDGAA